MELDEARWLALDRRPGETLRSGLERTLREAIRSRALRAGVRLPASRSMAEQLGVSRGVVTDAYGQLEAQGFLVTRPREAPVVAVFHRSPVVATEADLPPSPARYDLTPTAPDVGLFPLSRWLAAAQMEARRASVSILDYRDPRGEPGLRDALADHLGRTRGVIAHPRQIIVVQGTAQGVDVVLRLLRSRGATRIAVEDPSHVTQHERIRALGLELIPQPTDAHGMIVDHLDADAVIVTPAHQFPTGSVLSGVRRRELIAWARTTGGLILEDDYDSEFRYDGNPVRALQGLAPEHVAYLGTVSKTLAPALRLGWVIVPDALSDSAAATKRLLDDFSPVLDQLALSRFLMRGDYDRHVRRARGVYRSRRNRVIAALANHLPALSVAGVAAGVHIVVRLPMGVDDHAISEDAHRDGIRVPPLSRFHITPPPVGGLVIGYGRLREPAVDLAIHSLAEVVRRHLA